MPRCATRRRARCSPRCGRWQAGWPATSLTWTCAGSAPNHAEGAGRVAGRGARQCPRGGHGGGGPRPRAARHPARIGRGRRGCLRPHGHHRRVPRGAPGRLRARARASVRPGRASPARARVVELSLLHELRGHGRRASTPPTSPRCSRSWATRCSWSATTAPCACMCTPTSPSGRSSCSSRSARCLASTWPTCTSRWPSARRASRASPRRRPGAPSWPSRAEPGSSGSTRSSESWWWTAERR